MLRAITRRPTFGRCPLRSYRRKYRLSLTLATQYLKQMERNRNTVTRDAVFGNVGSIISFRVGPDDGEDLARQLSKYEDQVTSPI